MNIIAPSFRRVTCDLCCGSMQFGTFGPDKVSKIATKPLTLGLVQGKRTLVSTKIRQSLANSRIIVYGIDKVLYVCRK